MRRSLLVLAAILAVALVGCGQEFRTPALNRQQALSQTEVLEMKVVKVWNVVTDALDHDREPGIGYYVEVDVLSGSNAGAKLTLPYDDWNVGKPPPAVGTRVIAAPADWVKRGRHSKGAAFGGW